jgi:hypothetical protein
VRLLVSDAGFPISKRNGPNKFGFRLLFILELHGTHEHAGVDLIMCNSDGISTGYRLHFTTPAVGVRHGCYPDSEIQIGLRDSLSSFRLR